MTRRYHRRRPEGSSTSRVDLRLTEAERAAWVAAAGDLPLSEWIRRACDAAARCEDEDGTGTSGAVVRVYGT